MRTRAVCKRARWAGHALAGTLGRGIEANGALGAPLGGRPFREGAFGTWLALVHALLADEVAHGAGCAGVLAVAVGKVAWVARAALGTPGLDASLAGRAGPVG